jgi:hypothetical protein
LVEFIVNAIADMPKRYIEEAPEVEEIAESYRGVSV